MKVYQLARDLGTTSEVILKTLKSLKLKAVDQDQELNVVVVSVLKSHLTPEKRDQLEKEAASDALKKGAKKRKVVKAEDSDEDEDKDASAEEKPQAPDVADIKPQVPVAPVVPPAVKVEDKVQPKAPERTVPVIQPAYQARPSSVPPGARPATAFDARKSPIQPMATARPLAVKPGAPAPAQDPTKGKGKITNDPVITLKPWGKKKRKEDDAREEFDRLLDKGHKIGKVAQEAMQAPKVFDKLQDIEIDVPITVKDLSARLQQKPSVILMHLMKSGIMANINLSLDKEMVEKIAKDFGFNVVKIRTAEEQVMETHLEEEVDPSTLKSRAPVVTFMGHVDHGKTSLLDTIRKSKVVDTEHGGITQHMRAYSVKTDRGMITFLDTPGHEAFTSMRSRSAHITDLVVLVVAADEGIMPQTEEAIDHARAANVPIVVALNKIDKKNIQPDMVKKQLAEHDLAPEDWGGKTVVVPVSAHTGQGLDQLLEMILLEAEVLELKANHDKKASGIVVEAHMSQGRGAIATLIVQSGKLKEGDIVVVGPHYGKIKAMFDDRHKHVYEAGPSIPVEVLGLSNVPEAGETFYVVEDERKAKEITDVRQEKLKNQRLSAQSRLTLEDLQAQIQKGDIKELRIVIKGDVQGSVEAIKESLMKIQSEKVRLKILHTGVGDVNTSDVLLAAVSKAIIVAFHVGVAAQARKELERDPVDIREYRIIYDVVSDVKKALEGLLERKTKKNFLGRVEIREVFKLTKGIIAGCYVQKGRVTRRDHVDLLRDGQVIFSGKLSSLKRFKDDVKEVTETMECGMTIGGFHEYQKGDIIEAYEVESIQQTL